MSGEVVRFKRPAACKAILPSSAVKLISVPHGADPHVFFGDLMRAWVVEAERQLGVHWASEVLKNRAAYMEARRLHGAGLGENEQ